jgi:hypothetical protein
MSMGIGGAAFGAATSVWQSRRQDFGSLISSIKSGDLAGAQQAITALSGLGPSASSGAAASSATSTTSTGTGGSLADGLAAIGQALGSGDISGAQQALGKLFAERAGGHAPAAAASTGSTTTPAVSSGSTISILV